MSDRATRRLVTLLAGFSLAMVTVTLVLIPSNIGAPGVSPLGFNGVGGIVLAITYPIVGWLVASRQRRNPIGWVFLVVGLSGAVTGISAQYAIFGLVTRPGSLPLADVLAWVGVWSWVPGFLLLFVVLLLFPDGRPPSRRWWAVLWFTGAVGALLLVPTAIAAWGYRGPALLRDIPPDLSRDPLIAAFVAISTVASLLMVVVGVASITSLIVRFRRSAPVARQQIKWVAAAGLIQVGLLVATNFVTLPAPFDVLAAILVVPLVPIAIGIAILRYRLYDIDRIISRTVSYGAVTGILALVFVGTILVSQTVLASFFSGNSVAVAASTLVVAALFQPLRRRVQSVVDRRFNRSRYDAERTVAAFSVRLRDEVDLADVDAAIRAVVSQTVAPAAVGLWMRQRGPS